MRRWTRWHPGSPTPAGSPGGRPAARYGGCVPAAVSIVVAVVCAAALAFGMVRVISGARDIAATYQWTESERGRRGNRTLAWGAAFVFVGLAGLSFLAAIVL